MALVLGVDSSTQSTKVEARRLDTGEVVATASAPHPPTTPPVSEQHPDAWWAALVDAVSTLGDLRRSVVAMSVAGQQHGLVLLDTDGVALRPAQLWNDTTSAPQAERLVAAIGAERWAGLTGSVPVASFTITKLARVAEHEPDVLARTAFVQLPHDHLTWRLTGAHVTDRGDASGSGWVGVDGEVLVELLDAATGDGPAWAGRVPRILGPTEAAGRLTGAAADALGLPADVVIGPGTGDNMAAALGLGLGPGDAAVSLGTSGTVFGVSEAPTHDPTGAVAGFADATGRWLPLVCTLNATKVTDTVARWLGTDPSGLAQLALSASEEPGTVVLVPYLDGERTPNLPDATGTLHGITTATTAAQLALAAHDGVLCGLLDGLDRLAEVGGDVGGRLLLVGGGARSAAYRQRLADLTGRPVLVPATDETVATGAAVQAAAVVAGEPLEVVVERWALGTGTVVDPEVDAADRRHAYAAVRRSAPP